MIAPPAMAWPFTAATTGFGTANSSARPSASWTRNSSRYRRSPFRILGKSTPAEKMGPAAVITTARASEPTACRSAWRSASRNSMSKALALPCAISSTAIESEREVRMLTACQGSRLPRRLLQHHHLPRRAELPRPHSDQVDARAHPPAARVANVPLDLVAAGRERAVRENSHPPALKIQDLQLDPGADRKIEPDGGTPGARGVRKALIEREPPGQARGRIDVRGNARPDPHPAGDRRDRVGRAGAGLGQEQQVVARWRVPGRWGTGHGKLGPRDGAEGQADKALIDVHLVGGGARPDQADDPDLARGVAPDRDAGAVGNRVGRQARDHGAG